MKLRASGQEAKELRAQVETERQGRQLALEKAEGDHRRKYEQLKVLVEQYKDQMKEYVRIT